MVGFFRRRYRPGLQFALNRPRLVLGVAIATLLGAAFLSTRLGSEFVPRLREGAVVINTIRLAGVSLDESVRYGTQIEKTLLQEFPNEIERVWSRTGSAEVATDPMGLELSDIFITLKDRREWVRARTQDDLVAVMQSELAAMPAMRMVFTQPIEMRVNEMIAGIRADVGVKLFGDDFEVLKSKAREIESVMRGIPGTSDAFSEQVTGAPAIQIDVDREAIARHGIDAREVLDVIEALGSRPAGMLQEGDRRFPITIRIDDRYRGDIASLGGILVASAGGDRVPLASLTRITETEGPSTINREWARRRVVIQANVRGRDVGSYVEALQGVIDRQVTLPPGYYVRYGGQFEHLERARTRLLIVVPVALALIFGLLYLTYHRVQDALRVFTGVPFAAVGGILALWLRDIPFSISAAVGFIALSGVAVLGDMVLVSTIRQNLARGVPLRSAIEQAADRRLRPVLM
ncbi:MAG: cation transporter, partial [bacterium]